MKKYILSFFLLPLFASAQEAPKGMKFEHGVSWADIKAKAKAENKFIFMDCFTTWCGPCTYMTKNIFPLDSVGAFYNDKYIMVKVQLDTTQADNEEVKKWYQDGHDLAGKYEVRVYPTYLFFDGNAQLVHRAVGSSDAKTFLGKGKDAITPEKQYYTQLSRYEKGEKSPAFLHDLSMMAMGAYDMKNAAVISDAYIATQSDLFTKENIDYINMFTTKTTDKGFAVFVSNPAKVNAVLGEGKAEKKVLAILTNEAYGKLRTGGVASADFTAYADNAAKKYPAYAEESISKAKLSYFQSKKDWPNFEAAVVAYMNKYGAKATDAELNSFAWTVFENCKDMTCVAEALDWSKRSFKDKENPMFMDTYANILHKLGKTKEAIEWEEKALALVKDDAEKKTYSETIAKMKKGEKTWAD